MDGRPRGHDDGAVYPDQAGRAEVAHSAGQGIAFGEVVGILQTSAASSGIVRCVGWSAKTRLKTTRSVFASSSAGIGSSEPQSIGWEQDMRSFASLCLRRPVVFTHGSPLSGAR